MKNMHMLQRLQNQAQKTEMINKQIDSLRLQIELEKMQLYKEMVRERKKESRAQQAERYYGPQGLQ